MGNNSLKVSSDGQVIEVSHHQVAFTLLQHLLDIKKEEEVSKASPCSTPAFKDTMYSPSRKALAACTATSQPPLTLTLNCQGSKKEAHRPTADLFATEPVHFSV